MTDIIHDEVIAIVPTTHIVTEIGGEPIMEERLVSEAVTQGGIPRRAPGMGKQGHIRGLQQSRSPVEFILCRFRGMSHDILKK